MTDNEADVALMERIRAGDREAFRELVERYQRVVIHLIHRAVGDAWEAEDLAQRVFVQVYRSAHRYRPTAKFTTWLFTIVHHTVLNEQRRRRRRATESLDALQQSDPAADRAGWQPADPRAADPAQAAAEQELQEQLGIVLRELPPQQRTAVILCRFEGRSYAEIAAVLGCSVPAVKSLLHRARVTLLQRLKPFLPGGV